GTSQLAERRVGGRRRLRVPVTPPMVTACPLCAGERGERVNWQICTCAITKWFSRVQAYPADGCGDTVVPPGVSVAPLERAASIQIPMASLNEYAYRSPSALVRSSSAPPPCLSCPHNPASAFAWGSRRRSRRIE